MTPVEIAYIVVAVAIVALVIFLAVFLYKASKAVEQVNQLIENSNYKMRSLDPFFNALCNVGEGLEERTSSFKEHIHCQCCSSQKKSPVEQYLRLALLGTRIFNDIQTRR